MSSAPPALGGALPAAYAQPQGFPGSRQAGAARRYKARSYRARSVRNPRAVLKEFGTEVRTWCLGAAALPAAGRACPDSHLPPAQVPKDMTIQVLDSNADSR